ncbi:hypothetical protein CRE_23649 [Caenorhabditis remanei]|uniref:Uncharacterized protein n=1 Tax=Caenorhabditis remanei TaxID=31234 RepID=E3N4A1_CAERE|nr:hypothetical protein CRE_23649 [Caenorhabditis remanei]
MTTSSSGQEVTGISPPAPAAVEQPASAAAAERIRLEKQINEGNYLDVNLHIVWVHGKVKYLRTKCDGFHRFDKYYMRLHMINLLMGMTCPKIRKRLSIPRMTGNNQSAVSTVRRYDRRHRPPTKIIHRNYAYEVVNDPLLQFPLPEIALRAPIDPIDNASNRDDVETTGLNEKIQRINLRSKSLDNIHIAIPDNVSPTLPQVSTEVLNEFLQALLTLAENSEEQAAILIGEVESFVERRRLGLRLALEHPVWRREGIPAILPVTPPSIATEHFTNYLKALLRFAEDSEEQAELVSEIFQIQKHIDYFQIIGEVGSFEERKGLQRREVHKSTESPVSGSSTAPVARGALHEHESEVSSDLSDEELILDNESEEDDTVRLIASDGRGALDEGEGEGSPDLSDEELDDSEEETDEDSEEGEEWETDMDEEADAEFEEDEEEE